MLEVRSFCLYRSRTESRCFVPDLRSFPAYHQRVKPHIFSDAEVAKLLCAASGLRQNPSSPLPPEVIRLAIVLLCATGIRRGELLALKLGDYNRREFTLHIRETKFYKSRLLPISDSIAGELEQYLHVRPRRKLPFSSDSALIWNVAWGGGAYSATSLQQALRPLLQKCGIVTAKGKLPRIHDFRHSFAVNALLRWYRAGRSASDIMRRSVHCSALPIPNVIPPQRKSRNILIIYDPYRKIGRLIWSFAICVIS